MEAAATAAATPSRPKLLAVGSWVVYDLANTIFSFNIVSLFFSLWIVNDMGGKDSDYALANSFSMFVVFLVAPFLGALSDQTPRRMPFLIAHDACVLRGDIPAGNYRHFHRALDLYRCQRLLSIRLDLLRLAAAGRQHKGKPGTRGRYWCRRGLHGIVHRRSDGTYRITDSLPFGART